MTYTIQCPACASTLEADAGLLGKQVRCGRCEQVFDARPVNGSTIPIVQPAPHVPRYEVGIAPPRRDEGAKGTLSVVLGLLGLVGWCLPIVGLPITIAGLTFGVKSVNSSNRGAATIGIVLNVIGLILTLINGALGAYLAVTNQHPLLKR
jgi:predicted Zn finger-like uncharacterized protein